MGLPARMQTVVRQQETDVMRSPYSTAIGGQTRPGEVWTLLTPGQQQVVFRTLVVVCHSLIRSSTKSADSEGGER
jgi:hypothetical protein